MSYSETFVNLEKLFNKYSLGKQINEPTQITGGLLHKMYQVITDHKKYAVKEMNPSIMLRDGVVENIINSECIAEALGKIVPAISAIQFNSNTLLSFDGKYYMIFDWLEGKSVFAPDITSENCSNIGMLLGKIHTANVIIPNIHRETTEFVSYEWNKYLQLGYETGAKWTSQLVKVIDVLYKWNQVSNKACLSLSGYLVLSHRDLDPKNIMWKDGSPYIIDWEAAGYVNPCQELSEVLNYWASSKGEIDKDKFEAIYHGYIKIAGKCQVNWETVLASGYSGMLGWLNYSFKRSLGIECSSLEEKNLGTEQVFGTINALKQYAEQTVLLKDWLKEMSE